MARSTLFRSRISRTCWKVIILETAWNIVVDEPFSEAVVVEAVRKWLESRSYEFGVRMVEMEKARGSGLVKKLRERSED